MHIHDQAPNLFPYINVFMHLLELGKNSYHLSRPNHIVKDLIYDRLKIKLNHFSKVLHWDILHLQLFQTLNLKLHVIVLLFKDSHFITEGSELEKYYKTFLFVESLCFMCFIL